MLAEGDVTIPTHEPRLSLFIQQATGGVQGAVSSGSFSALARTLLEVRPRCHRCPRVSWPACPMAGLSDGRIER